VADETAESCSGTNNSTAPHRRKEHSALAAVSAATLWPCRADTVSAEGEPNRSEWWRVGQSNRRQCCKPTALSYDDDDDDDNNNGPRSIGRTVRKTERQEMTAIWGPGGHLPLVWYMKTDERSTHVAERQ
jgi:hypothetical protein